MAEAYKKEKKKKGKGSSRRKYLTKFAKAGSGRPRGEYTKYGDVPKSEIHERAATYRGSQLEDDPSVNINNFRNFVHRGHGKAYFRFQGKLYRVTGGGSGQEEVQV